MIDTKELRRLAQAATPGPWINHGRQPNVAGLPHSAVAAKTLLARVYSEAYGDVEQETANASFIAAANPAAVSELLDRLEAAEKELAELRSSMKFRASLLGRTEAERDALRAEVETTENDAAHQKALADSALRVAEGWERKCGELRAKIAEMEQQEPVAWMQSTHLSSFKNRLCGSQSSYVHCSDHQLHPDFKPLYALPGAQPAPSVPVVTPKMEQAFYEKVEVTTVGSIRGLADGIKAAMLAAAPEAKP